MSCHTEKYLKIFKRGVKIPEINFYLLYKFVVQIHNSIIASSVEWIEIPFISNEVCHLHIAYYITCFINCIIQ